MRLVSKTKIQHFSLVLGLGIALNACDNSDDDDENVGEVDAVASYTAAEATLSAMSAELRGVYDAAPATYTFSRDGASTVSYTGQVFRQVLIEDLKTYIGNLKQGLYQGTEEEALAALNSYLNYSFDNASTAAGVINGSSTIAVQPTDLSGNNLPIAEGNTYADLQDPGKNLSGKLAFNDNTDGPRAQLLGWNSDQVGSITVSSLDFDGEGNATEPEDLLQAWFRIIADQSINGQSFTIANGDQPAQSLDEAYITESGLDLNQLVQKFLHGAVSLSQAADDYLSSNRGETKGVLADNEEIAKPGVRYTALEHHWDEAFGYYGAAQDFLSYTDEQVKTKGSIDTNGDGSIALLSEKNFGIAINSAKRDLDATTELNFSENIMKAFLAGRHLIDQKPEGYREVLPAIATIIRVDWERVVAASAIHYVNKTISEMDEFGTENYLFKDHAKFWGELKGFALGLQFSPEKILTDEQFVKFHDLVGDVPVLGSEGAEKLAEYKAKLEEARLIIQEAYGFSSEDAANW